MKPKSPHSPSDLVLDMSPMIDLSFLLLVYFLVTSTLDPVESDLVMKTPGIPTPGTPIFEFDPMTVEVDGEGQIFANGELLDTEVTSRDVPMLLDRLKTYTESAKLTDTAPVVFLAADDAAKGQRFIDVLNALADERVDIQNVILKGFREE